MRTSRLMAKRRSLPATIRPHGCGTVSYTHLDVYKRQLRGHQGEVWSAQFSADGKTVLTASSDLTARLWDVASGRQRGVLSGHQGPVRTAQFSADGKTIITASEDNTARLWDCLLYTSRCV